MISVLQYLSTLFLAVISVSMNKITVGGNGIMIILWSPHPSNNNDRIRSTFEINIPYVYIMYTGL